MMEGFAEVCIVAGVLACVGLFVGGITLAVVAVINYRHFRKVRSDADLRAVIKECRKDNDNLRAKCNSLQADLKAANREIETLRGIHAVDTAYLTQD